MTEITFTIRTKEGDIYGFLSWHNSYLRDIIHAEDPRAYIENEFIAKYPGEVGLSILPKEITVNYYDCIIVDFKGKKVIEIDN